MRKTLLLLAALGLGLPALAQTERGSKVLGVSVGNLSYSRSNYDGTSFSAALHPEAGYFVADNLTLGTGLLLGYARQRAGFDFFYREFSYGLAPFARYYVPGSGRHRLFAEAGGDFARTHYRGLAYRLVVGGPQPEEKRAASVYGVHGALGYSFFLTSTAALEATAGYLRFLRNPVEQVRGVVDVRLGFRVYLPAGGSK